jgi:RNA polymerase sigma-70 factor (ECF subfamily)
MLEHIDWNDPASIDRLYRTYLQKVLELARARMDPTLRRRAETMDLVQSAFREALQHFDQLEGRSEGQFLHWVGSIVQNKIHSERERLLAAKRDVRRETPHDAPLAAASRESPSRVAAQHEQWERLLAGLDRLPPLEREILLLKRFEHLTWEEIGEILELPVRTAQDTELRAKARLAQFMDRADPA